MGINFLTCAQIMSIITNPSFLEDFTTPFKDDSYNEGRVIIFTTKENLQKLKASKMWFADGTFKPSPSFFYNCLPS